MLTYRDGRMVEVEPELVEPVREFIHGAQLIRALQRGRSYRVQRQNRVAAVVLAVVAVLYVVAVL